VAANRADAAASAVARRSRRIGTSAAEILIDSPEIAPPLPLTESWQRRHLYEALNAAFGIGPKPLLLLIDDMQWCDQDSYEWLHHFCRWSRWWTFGSGTVRPEEMGRSPLGRPGSECANPDNCRSSLAPLSVEESAALAVEAAGRECAHAFLVPLYQATKGNPLFIVESVRASLEDQASQNSVPPRVQAVIAARLALLSPPAYELAGLADAIGRPFSFDLLAKATDWDEDSLSHALEELWQRRIVNGLGTGAYDYSRRSPRGRLRELSPIRRRSWHNG
jgi:hypothetical protein